VQAVLSRERADAQALADQVGAPVAASETEALPPTVRLVLLCVPDAAVATVADALAACEHPWSRTVVAHTSGALTSAVLSPLAELGTATLGFHPMQTFAPETPPEAVRDIVVGVEGTETAVAVGTALAEAMGARPVVLSAEAKAQYHGAAALASNGLVALVAAVEEVLREANVEADAIPDIVEPLLDQTWANLKANAPEAVLTGPVARGDRSTIEAHLDALQEATPHLLPLYSALTTEMVRIAVRGGQIDGDTAHALLATLRTVLPAPPGEGPEPPS
jgi:predicted short-subunit dehydrogenase-like oxidoreductase (DUF2520 family)